MRNFMQILGRRSEAGFSVCVGLDSAYDKLPLCLKIAAESAAAVYLHLVNGVALGKLGDFGNPTTRVGMVERLRAMAQAIPIEHAIFEFNRAIVDATCSYVLAFKLNLAFYESQGAAGWAALKRTVAYIHKVAPDVIVILDGKRADIGNTNDAYATALFDELGGDAMTTNPYFGGEALAPFLKRRDKGIFVLCRTSNPGAGEVQDLPVYDRQPVYLHLARTVAEGWNDGWNCGLVVGATAPAELAAVRQIFKGPILNPGLGKQGGDVEAAVRAGQGGICIFNSSRDIIFASAGEDFAKAAGAKARALHEQISTITQQLVASNSAAAS